MSALRHCLSLFLLLFGAAPTPGGPEAQTQPTNPALRPEPRWAYRNEEAWIVSDITRDIGEMVAYGKDRSLLESGAITIEGQPSPSSSTGPPSFDVSVALPKAAPVSAVVVLDEHIWSPKSYLNFAQLLLGRAGLKAATAGSLSQG